MRPNRVKSEGTTSPTLYPAPLLLSATLFPLSALQFLEISSVQALVRIVTFKATICSNNHSEGTQNSELEDVCHRKLRKGWRRVWPSFSGTPVRILIIVLLSERYFQPLSSDIRYVPIARNLEELHYKPFALLPYYLVSIITLPIVRHILRSSIRSDRDI
jgi:hypothetical protein